MHKLVTLATVFACVYAATVPANPSSPAQQPSVKSQPLHHSATTQVKHDVAKDKEHDHKAAPVKENLKEDPKKQAEKININEKNHNLGHEKQKSQSLNAKEHPVNYRNSKDFKHKDDKTHSRDTAAKHQIPVKIVQGSESLKQGKPEEKSGKVQENKENKKH